MCGVCGTRLDKAGKPPLSSSTVGNRNPKRSKFVQQSKPYWTVAKILVLLLAVVVGVSAVGAGSYYAARQAGPNCANGTTNYPTCDSCPSGQISHFDVTPSCHCTNGTHNPPSCNEPCSNGAINFPNCDLCPDGHTDSACSPLMTPESHTVAVDFLGSNRTPFHEP